jgi:hypothetical protein
MADRHIFLAVEFFVAHSLPSAVGNRASSGAGYSGGKAIDHTGIPSPVGFSTSGRPNNPHQYAPRFSFRFPQCVSLRVPPVARMTPFR